MSSATCHHHYPPFSTSVATAPLVIISLEELENNIVSESHTFFQACQDLGVIYLRLEGSPLGKRLIESAEQVHHLQRQFFQRPNAEKEEFAREKIDAFFGYRHHDVEGTEGVGGKGRVEMYNLRKDGILGLRPPLPCHQLAKHNKDLLRKFVLECREVIELLLMHLESHLQLRPGTLSQLHRLYEQSGDHVRFTQAPVQPFNLQAARAGEHTDFETLTILFNWLGGSQIRRPDTDEWVYVRPVPGTAVVNLGDALVKFTAGLLRSDVHRVVPAPPPQDRLIRNSLVYFSRPEDKVVLKRLKGGLNDAQPAGEGHDEAEMTAEEWTLRRSVGDLKGVFTHRNGLERRSEYGKPVPSN